MLMNHTVAFEMQSVIVSHAILTILIIESSFSQALFLLRTPRSSFIVNNLTLTSNSQIRLQCESYDRGYNELAIYRMKTDFDIGCGGSSQASYWTGPICIHENICPKRNYTCCVSKAPIVQEYGLATLDGELELCKGKVDGWESRLEIYSVLEKPKDAALINVVTGVSFNLGGEDIKSSDSLRYRVEIESDISSMALLQFRLLAKAFYKYCNKFGEKCSGARYSSFEERVGSFACFSPPSRGISSPRQWLELNFPVLTIDVGDISNRLCISPWSYFVPVSLDVYCVGIVIAKEENLVIGGNFLEGNRIKFGGNGNVTFSTSTKNGNCVYSELCLVTTRPPTRPLADISNSPTIEIYSTNSPSVDIHTNSPTSLPSRHRSSSPSHIQSHPRTHQPSIDENHHSNGLEGYSPSPSFDVNNNGDDDTDYSPFIWLGIGSGLTFVANIILLLYCRYCRRSTQHSFTRLPGEIELTSPRSPAQISPGPIMQIDNTLPVLSESQSRAKSSLETITTAAAAPFEPNPVIQGGAAAFEKAWNQGLIVDVWGITLRSWQPKVVVDLLVRLRLLRVAGGTVSGVEKMYWLARQRVVMGSPSDVLGMIEISVDLNSKRLSAVFKMSRSAGSSTSQSAQHLHTLFDAFKTAVEESLC